MCLPSSTILFECRSQSSSRLMSNCALQKRFSKMYLPMMRKLFLTAEIDDYQNNSATLLRDYLQGSSTFLIPPPLNKRGRRFVDEIIRRPADVEALKEYVLKGGLLLLFHTDRQLAGAVFDWTFGKGVRCEAVDFGAVIATIIPPQSSEYEDASGLLLQTGVSPTTATPVSLLLCTSQKENRLSPLFSVPEGKGAVVVLGLDVDHSVGYGRDNWAQALVHVIVQLSRDPILISGRAGAKELM